MRHAKPDYSKNLLTDTLCWQYLSPLLESSREELRNRNFDQVKNVDFIVSSPFTRALETAYIVSGIINKKVIVERDLHEWLPDVNSIEQIGYAKTATELFFKNIPGKYETIESCRDRLLGIFQKYQENNVLFVAHARLFSSVLNRSLDFAEIAECNYHQI